VPVADDLATERFAAFLFFVEDWLSSTAVDLMTADEERGFLRLLLHSWKTPDCGLPNDDRILAHLSKLGKLWHGKSGAAVRAEFIERDGRLFNERLLRERQNQISKRRARSSAGKAGAKARWRGQLEAEGGSSDSNAMVQPMADAWQTGWQNDASSSPSLKAQVETTPNTCASGDALVDAPLPIHSLPEATESKAAPAVVTKKATKRIDGLAVLQDGWFAEWWPTYWRHVARAPARKAFGKRVRTPERFEQVMAATRAQTPEMLSREPQHRPHGATWLNGERWADDTTESVNQETAEERVARMIYGEKTA
jgi:uncharacterized protein YdaU (DUF1376 family)